MSVRAPRAPADLNVTDQSWLGPRPSNCAVCPWAQDALSTGFLSVVGVPVSSLSLALTPRWTKPLRCMLHLVLSLSLVLSTGWTREPNLVVSQSPVLSLAPSPSTHDKNHCMALVHHLPCLGLLLSAPNSVRHVKIPRDSAPLVVALPAQGSHSGPVSLSLREQPALTSP